MEDVTKAIRVLKEVVKELEFQEDKTENNVIGMAHKDGDLIFQYANGTTTKSPEGSSIYNIGKVNLGRRIEYNCDGCLEHTNIGYSINGLLKKGYKLEKNGENPNIIFVKDD